jgi:hypothetical protein
LIDICVGACLAAKQTPNEHKHQCHQHAKADIQKTDANDCANVYANSKSTVNNYLAKSDFNGLSLAW